MGYYVFNSCLKLKEIVMPPHMFKIDRAAFSLSELEKVYWTGDVPRYIEDGYLSLSKSSIFYYPRGNATWTEELRENWRPMGAGIEWQEWNPETGEVYEPTPEPTEEPTKAPTAKPTKTPTQKPTMIPTQEPTIVPTQEPTMIPTQEPTIVPTQEPTIAPTEEPTMIPTQEPTIAPTIEPTQEPTIIPTQEPTMIPTQESTEEPTIAPTQSPVIIPTSLPTSIPELPTGTPMITPAVQGNTTSPPVISQNGERPDIGESNGTEKQGVYPVQKIRGKVSGQCYVKLTWEKNDADGYFIYRRKLSKKKLQLLKTTSDTFYRDKNVAKGKVYIYYIYSYRGNGRQRQVSAPVEKKVKIPYHLAPVVKMKKKKSRTAGKYLQISIRGKEKCYMEMYLKNRGKMKRYPVKKEKGKKWEVRLSYRKLSGKVFCKARVYDIRKVKKRYSKFSKVKSIRL